MTKLYYTPKEARDILNMTYGGLMNQVAAGNIRRVIPPGRRQGVFIREDVDRLKREMDTWLISRGAINAPAPKFVKATAEAMVEGVSIADAVFGGVNTIPVEKRIAWLKQNPDIDYFVKHEDRIVGYLSLVPLKLETISDLLTGKRFAKDLEPSEILPYQPGKPVDIYAMAIGVLPGVSITQKRDWGAVLIKGAIDVIIGLGQQGIIIRTIQAHSNTPDGIRLMRHIGFTETVASIPGMRDFKINITESGIPFIMEYKEAFATWEKQHKGIKQ
jgi:hypothetical protein